MAASPQPIPNKARRGLSPEELKQLRRHLIKENLSHDPPSSDGRRAWDSADGRKITCLLCGRQLSNLGDRGTAAPNHLLDEHEMTTREYSAHCQQQGWGDAPAASLNTRELRAKWRDAHREEIKTLNQKGRSKRNEYRKKHRDQEAAAQFARKQRKLLPKLTPEQNAAWVPCPLCERDGHPEYRFQNLYSSHVTRFHKMSWKQFKKEFPNVRVGTEDEKARQGVQVQKMRAKLLSFPARAPRQIGRHPTAPEQKTWFLVGQLVEGKIPARRKDSKSAIVTARQDVADENPDYEVGVVAEYHKRYRRFIRNKNAQ